ncbi:MAG: DUF349 domain-containing protein [Bacteroidales bacterium]
MMDTQETYLPVEETGKPEETKTPEIVAQEDTAEEVVREEAPAEDAAEEIAQEEATAELPETAPAEDAAEEIAQEEATAELPETAPAEDDTEEVAQEEATAELPETAPAENAAEEVVKEEATAELPETAPAEDAAEEVVKEEATAELPETALAEDAVSNDSVARGEAATIRNGKLAKEEILDKLAELVNASIAKSRNEIESLKQTFYKLRRMEVDELKKAFMEGGGEEKDFQAPRDEAEDRIKQILTVYKEKKAALHVEEEQRKAANYALKLQLIERMKELTESQDDFNKLYNEFREIQQKWKEAKPVHQEHANELWKNFQIYSEKFYDLIKINNQFRDYDLKKNLELKTALCEAVEKLASEADVVSAFHQLQKLHQQWREIGPVARGLREELWKRFKAASSVVNKRHQKHFSGLKAKEQENLKSKIALCEQVEGIDFDSLQTFKDWDGMNRKIAEWQAEWKRTGFAPKKKNVKIFDRFRAACIAYFQRKSEFYKSKKGEMAKNLAMKTALCEQAEALKDSVEWRKTTELLIALQEEWKTIGAVPRKHSKLLWTRFITACDYFFQQRNEHVFPQGKERKGQAYRNNLTAPEAGKDKGKDNLYGEREKLMRSYDRLKNDLLTYENNIGFLSVSSKGGSGLVKEMERKIEKLKEEMARIVEKIDAIDANFE